jgi:hypothetical protein
LVASSPVPTLPVPGSGHSATFVPCCLRALGQSCTLPLLGRKPQVAGAGRCLHNREPTQERVIWEPPGSSGYLMGSESREVPGAAKDGQEVAAQDRSQSGFLEAGVAREHAGEPGPWDWSEVGKADRTLGGLGLAWRYWGATEGSELESSWHSRKSSSCWWRRESHCLFRLSHFLWGRLCPCSLPPLSRISSGPLHMLHLAPA